MRKGMPTHRRIYIYIFQLTFVGFHNIRKESPYVLNHVVIVRNAVFHLS
jgi:hypothetical protein